MATSRKLTAKDLYRQFQDSLLSFRPGSWTLGVFEGSPTDGLYSWCPDCVVASTHLRTFKESVLSPNAKLLNFKVGSRKEWESKQSLNPFKKNFPFLSDVPTVVLFFGRLDVMRIIAPRVSDLRFMLRRARTYEDQVRSKYWHPPVKFR
jgi:hypothetical protein